jgi:putative hydrolase of the HAD superfamily
VMAGNSIRSDILPALEAGAWAAFVPFELCWSHEAADAPEEHERFVELGSLGELAGWVDAIGSLRSGGKVTPQCNRDPLCG